MKKKLVRLLVQTAVLLLVEEVLQVLGLLQRMGQQIQNRMRLPMRLLLRLVEVCSARASLRLVVFLEARARRTLVAVFSVNKTTPHSNLEVCLVDPPQTTMPAADSLVKSLQLLGPAFLVAAQLTQVHHLEGFLAI